MEEKSQKTAADDENGGKRRTKRDALQTSTSRYRSSLPSMWSPAIPVVLYPLYPHEIEALHPYGVCPVQGCAKRRKWAATQW